MNILIVEDDLNKREQLHSFITAEFPNAGLRCAHSVVGAVKDVKANVPDVVLLDMTLPNYDIADGVTGRMLAFGGEEFLRQMVRFKISTNVIVVTQFETFGDAETVKDRQELDAELREQFRGIYQGMVYYHASLSEWSDELRSQLGRILKGRPEA